MLIEPEDDGDEHFVDAPEVGQTSSGTASAARPSALADTGYDGKKREPLYAHADTSCIWEIVRIHHPVLIRVSSHSTTLPCRAPKALYPVTLSTGSISRAERDTDNQLPLTEHFHPSISLLSTQLLLSQPLSGSADISGNTLISFLDKFVYRNPKKNVAQKGASVMQPAAAAYDAGKVRLQKGAKVGAESGVVNSEAFWRKKVAEVPVDQVCTFPIRIEWG